MSDISAFFPIRRGAKIFVRSGDKEIELNPLEASVLAQRWQEAVSGAYVAKMTEFALDELVSEAQELKMGY